MSSLGVPWTQNSSSHVATLSMLLSRYPYCTFVVLLVAWTVDQSDYGIFSCGMYSLTINSETSLKRILDQYIQPRYYPLWYPLPFCFMPLPSVLNHFNWDIHFLTFRISSHCAMSRWAIQQCPCMAL